MNKKVGIRTYFGGDVKNLQIIEERRKDIKQQQQVKEKKKQQQLKFLEPQFEQGEPAATQNLWEIDAQSVWGKYYNDDGAQEASIKTTGQKQAKVIYKPGSSNLTPIPPKISEFKAEK